MKKSGWIQMHIDKGNGKMTSNGKMTIDVTATPWKLFSQELIVSLMKSFRNT